MNKIVLYAETVDVPSIDAALPGYEIVAAAGMNELAGAIVEQSPVVAVVIEKRELDEQFRRLLFSLKLSFPMLPGCLISSPLTERLPDGYHLLAAGANEEETAAKIGEFVAASGFADRRDRPRFDWPLQGLLSFDREHWQKHKLWALSADGAFLEAAGSPPAAGSKGFLRITFRNSRLVTHCEVLDPRQASSRLPAGFAVRFTLLSQDSKRLLDRIVQDTLVQTLLEPETEPDIPSLGEEELSISGFEPLDG
jgi:hypothetical protein